MPVSPTIVAKDKADVPTTAEIEPAKTSGGVTQRKKVSGDMPPGTADVTEVSSPQVVKAGGIVARAKGKVSTATGVGLDAVSSGAWVYPLYVSYDFTTSIADKTGCGVSDLACVEHMAF
jgi:hypothetical protein